MNFSEMLVAVSRARISKWIFKRGGTFLRIDGNSASTWRISWDKLDNARLTPRRVEVSPTPATMLLSGSRFGGPFSMPFLPCRQV